MTLSANGMQENDWPNDATVAVDGLTKSYGKMVAVDRISFAVQPGETFGLLGPNGAGKTTTLEMIAGLTRADRGDAFVHNLSVSQSTLQAQRLLGIVPQRLALYQDLSARQNLDYFARLRGLPRHERKQQVDDILVTIGLADDAKRKVSTFSGGMKRRLNVGIGLIGRPRVLLLDEPTVGIDPQSRRHILDCVRCLAAGGVTVLYTSHYMEEFEYLCQRVAIMDHGRIIAQGPIDEVRALAGESVVLRLPAPRPTVRGEVDLEAVRREVGVPLEVRGGELHFVLAQGSAQVPSVLRVLQQHGISLDGMRVDAPNLETVFLSLTGKALRDQGGVAS